MKITIWNQRAFHQNCRLSSRSMNVFDPIVDGHIPIKRKVYIFNQGRWLQLILNFLTCKYVIRCFKIYDRHIEGHFFKKKSLWKCVAIYGRIWRKNVAKSLESYRILTLNWCFESTTVYLWFAGENTSRLTSKYEASAARSRD